MDRAVALIGCPRSPILPTPDSCAEFMTAFANQQLPPYRGSRSFAFASACRKIFALTSFACHNCLHPFKFFLGYDGLVFAPYRYFFNFAVVLNLFLRQIIRRVFLVVGHDPTIEAVAPSTAAKKHPLIGRQRESLFVNHFSKIFQKKKSPHAEA